MKREMKGFGGKRRVSGYLLWFAPLRSNGRLMCTINDDVWESSSAHLVCV